MRVTGQHDRRVLLPVLVAALVTSGGLAAVAPPADAAYAALAGSGSTSSAVLLHQWTSDVDAQGIPVTYTAGGSSVGRSDFAHGVTDFAVTDLPYSGADGDSSARPFEYVPFVAGGTAFAYRIEVGGDRVTNLRLSAPTLVGIFTGVITDWSDPAITADNNGRRLPALAIKPVVRSDGAGSSYQVTAWMDHEEPAAWAAYAGQPGPTASYPAGPGMAAEAGPEQALNRVAGPSGNGSIAYVENTYAALRDVPVVKVGNDAGSFVEPTADNVAIALRGAVVNPDGTQELAGVYDSADARAYPVSSYAYAVVPTGPDDPRAASTAKRQALVDLVYHSVCAGQSKAGAYGYAPLPRNLVEHGLAALDDIAGTDGTVDLAGRDLAHCANPTLDPADPDRDVLGETAPMPEPCDHVGQGPCGYVPPGPEAPATFTVQVMLTPVHSQRGTFAVVSGRRYTVRVRTDSPRTPRYYAPIAPGKKFKGAGKALTKGATHEGVHRWQRTARIVVGRGTWRLGVRVGTTLIVMRIHRR